MFISIMSRPKTEKTVYLKIVNLEEDNKDEEQTSWVYQQS